MNSVYWLLLGLEVILHVLYLNMLLNWYVYEPHLIASMSMFFGDQTNDGKYAYVIIMEVYGIPFGNKNLD